MLLAHRPAWTGVWMCAASLTCCPVALAATASCHTHTAVAGDTLIGLSQRYLAEPRRWELLARVNHVHNPRRIPIGQALCIPVDRMKATPKPGVVLEVVGEVTRRNPPGAGPGSAMQPVQKGDAVTQGMTLRTSTNGYVTVQLADGSILKIQADTQARLDNSVKYEEAGFFASTWTVLRGRVESLVTHLTGGQPRYQIKTPQAVLGVRGTEFRVATDDRQTWGETLDGTVAVSGAASAAVSAAGRTTLVVAGHGAVTNARAQVGAPQPLPAAPVLSGLPSLFERPLLRLDLPDVPGASSYRIQIADDANFRRVRTEATSSQPHFRVSDLPDGHYHLRARVANAQGLEGLDGTRPLQLKARPEPPIPTAPANHAKLRAREAQLNWTAHPQAQSYRLQVARDAGFTQLVVDQPALPDPQATVPLSTGDYHWRIATTAAGPDKGPWGDAQLLLMRDPPAQPPPPVITPDSLQFQLQAEPGQRFELQMASDAAFTQMLHAVASNTPDVTLPKPQEGGRLYVRYRAVDADGFIGPYTTPQMVLLPACVRSSDMQCVQSGERFITTQP